MARTITQQVGAFPAGNHSAIALSQSATTTTFTLNGALASNGVATLTPPRRIVIVSTGNDSGINFVVTGTNWSGNPWGETIAGTSISTSGPSVLDYLTVTSITATGTGVNAAAVAGTSISGTNSPVASSPYVFLDSYGFASVSLQVNVSGALQYTVESTQDNPNLTLPQTVVAPSAVVWFAHPVLVSATTTQQSSYTAQPNLVRLTFLTAATTGYATFDVTQAGGSRG